MLGHKTEKNCQMKMLFVSRHVKHANVATEPRKVMLLITQLYKHVLFTGLHRVSKNRTRLLCLVTPPQNRTVGLSMIFDTSNCPSTLDTLP